MYNKLIFYRNFNILKTDKRDNQYVARGYLNGKIAIHTRYDTIRRAFYIHIRTDNRLTRTVFYRPFDLFLLSYDRYSSKLLRMQYRNRNSHQTR